MVAFKNNHNNHYNNPSRGSATVSWRRVWVPVMPSSCEEWHVLGPGFRTRLRGGPFQGRSGKPGAGRGPPLRVAPWDCIPGFAPGCGLEPLYRSF